MKLPKIPIDYSKAGTGQAPFDMKRYLFHTSKNNIESGYWDDCNDNFSRLYCGSGYYQIWKHLSNGFNLPTHYSPMPQFEEVKGGEA